MTIALPVRPGRSTAIAWRRHAAALVAAIGAIGVLLHRDAAAIAATWWTSTTFQHCMVVAAVIVWLVWQRRDALEALRPVAWWPGLLAVTLGGVVWLIGEAGAATVARQFGLLAMVEGAVVTLLGPRVARGLAFPLGYAVFLIPFGEWMEAPLQAITVRLAVPLLHLVGIPAHADGVMIEAGRYWFEVAEACAGAKFVITMAAMGVLVAHLCFIRWSRRFAFLAMCLVLPVLANGVRAAGTMAIANWTSVEAAAGFDHIVYGWVWFAVVMAATLAVGWRWFDKPANAPALDASGLHGPVARRLEPLPAAGLTMAIVLAFTLWGHRAASRTTPLPPIVALPVVPGWQRVARTDRAAWAPIYADADRRLIGRYRNASGDEVDLAVALYEGQRDGRSLVAYGNGAIGPGWLRVADLPPIAGARATRIVAPGPSERIVTTRYAVGQFDTASPVVVRLATLYAHLIGGRQTAAAIHLSSPIRPGYNAVDAIRRFAAASDGEQRH